MSGYVWPLPARLPGAELNSSRIDRLVLVADADAEGGTVPVRWQLGRTPMFKCKACGPLYAADCLHAYAAGVLLAHELLGLETTITAPSTEGNNIS